MQHVDQRRQTQHIGRQHKFMVVFGLNGRAAFHKCDPCAPFVMGQVHVACKVMQVFDKRPHNLAHPRLHFIGHIPFENVRYVVFGDVAHGGKLLVQQGKAKDRKRDQDEQCNEHHEGERKRAHEHVLERNAVIVDCGFNDETRYPKRWCQ